MDTNSVLGLKMEKILVNEVDNETSSLIVGV